MQRILLLLAAILFLTPIDIYAEQDGIPTDIPEEYIIIDWEELYLEKDEVDLIGLVCLGEAEGESELGKRLVIDTILNRLDSDKWPNDIYSVCWQKGQFSCLHNGRCNKLKVTDYIRRLVIEEMEERTNSETIYFSAGGYNGRSPLFQEGGHYFSK